MSEQQEPTREAATYYSTLRWYEIVLMYGLMAGMTFALGYAYELAAIAGGMQ